MHFPRKQKREEIRLNDSFGIATAYLNDTANKIKFIEKEIRI